MKPMNLQEGSEQARGAREFGVITRTGDHHEEITQFDGEIVRKMMINEISTFLSTS